MKNLTAENAECAEKSDYWTGEIIGAAIEVHTTLGPGLLESAYEQCLVSAFNGQINRLTS